MGLTVPMIGHVGDGNFHSMYTYYNDEQKAKAEAAYDKLVKRALELDGTCESIA